MLIPPALAAEHMYELLAGPSEAALAAARRRQAVDVFGRLARTIVRLDKDA